MRTNREGNPNPINMLKMLLPNTVPMAKLFNPFLAELKTVKNSGAVVPSANKIPASAPGIFNISEISWNFFNW